MNGGLLAKRAVSGLREFLTHGRKEGSRPEKDLFIWTIGGKNGFLVIKQNKKIVAAQRLAGQPTIPRSGARRKGR